MIGGHGHVTPRPDGMRARCGGPGLCPVCSRELAGHWHPAAPTGGGPELAGWREGATLATSVLIGGAVALPWPVSVAGAPRDPYVRAVTVRLDEYADGDTFTCDVDLGFGTWVRRLCRLAGINAPDKGEGGRDEATAALRRVLASGPVVVESVRADKFAGRFDAVVVVTPTDGSTDPLIVNNWLVQGGYAVPWDGKGRRPVVPWPPPSRP